MFTGHWSEDADDMGCFVSQVDPSVTFDQVGGLDHYIRALKEMVFLPLVYPELFERFHLTPPRGVLFYGPPGKARMGCHAVWLARRITVSVVRGGIHRLIPHVFGL